MNDPTPDLTNLMEWNRFAEERKTVIETLTIFNNRHRARVQQLEAERDELREAISGRTVSCSQCEESVAETAWLKSALIDIRDMPEYDQDDAHRLRNKARLALHPTKAP